jgi:two-component system alkaline phosphatase synthesis response regulator PhoP
MQDGKHVILCIDDDPDTLMALRVVLESAGFVVVSASTAAEVIQCYESSRPDAMIVDLMMEQIDTGVKLARELQRLGNVAPLYFLSSTGDYLQGSMDVGELGASGVLQKPIDPHVLISLLQRKLGVPRGK